MTTTVVDNTVLSNFAHIEKPKLLREAFDSLVACHAVMDELAEGERLGRVPSVDWSWLAIVELSAEEQLHAEQYKQTLGRGETECIALAQSRGWIVLTDDWDARQVAKSGGVLVSGTLGALMNLVRQATLTIAEADVLLAEMKQRGYRCPVNSLSELEDR